MNKPWKYRLFCTAAALALTGAGPLTVLADNIEGTQQESSLNQGEALSMQGEEGAAANEAALLEAQAAAAALAEREAQVDAYFDGSVFVGDSVMLGFRNYAVRRQNTWLGRLQFLAAGSFSAHNALLPVTEKSVHPVYQGQKRLIWESLSMMGAKRVFLFFGLNDMNMGPLETTCEKYRQVIDNIRAACPETEIHLISMTYTLRGKGKGNLKNDIIRQYNGMLRQMAEENGWGYMELADRLADENGDLAPVYCSDNYVHQTNAAYDVWSAALREYAASQMDGTAACPYGGRKTEEPAPEEQTAGEKITGPAAEIELKEQESKEAAEP